MSQTATAAREPLLRIAKREGTTMPQKIAVRAIAILLALVVDALFIFFVTGLNPLSVYGVMWSGTFANMTRFSWMLRDLSTLLCVGIALAPAFKMRFWNCGGEGQILIGGLTAALIMVYQGNNLPLPLLFAAMALGSIAAGALWGFIPAWFKSRWNTNETLFTLMMNYIATQLVAYFIIIWEVPKGAGKIGIINQDSQAGWLPTIGNQKYLLAILVVAVMTGLMYIYLNYSKQGYEIAVVGDSVGTARYAGMKVNRIVLRTVFLSACLIGLAAAFKVGTVGILSSSFTDDVGWTGVIVAWLSQLNTGAIFLVSALISMLQHGSTVAAATFAQVDSSFADMLQGAILFLVLAADFLIRFKIVRTKKGGGENGNG